MAAPPRAKTIADRIKAKAKGVIPTAKPPLMRADAVHAVVSGDMLIYQAAREFGVSYTKLRTWIEQDHYAEVADRYQDKISEMQERAILSMEQQIEAMNLISRCAADPDWLANAEPDRINAMANLFKSQSETTIRFFEAVQRAAAKAGIGEDAQATAGANGQTKALSGSSA